MATVAKIQRKLTQLEIDNAVLKARMEALERMWLIQQGILSPHNGIAKRSKWHFGGRKVKE